MSERVRERMPFDNERSREEGQEVDVLRKVKKGFRTHKATILQQLDDPATYDRSKKGGVDAPIIDLVQFLNTPKSPFVTSSSCSGRVAIFAGAPPLGCEEAMKRETEERESKRDSIADAMSALESEISTVDGKESDLMCESESREASAALGMNGNGRDESDSDGNGSDTWMKGGEWLYVTHDPLGEEQREEVSNALDRIASDERLKNAMTTFKFEPFIIHVQCLSLSHARALLNCGLNAGFRNSGMVLGSKKLSVAIRSTMHLDVPIGLAGRLLVTREYVNLLIEMSNEKFKENVKRIGRLEKAVRELYCSAQ